MVEALSGKERRSSFTNPVYQGKFFKIDKPRFNKLYSNLFLNRKLQFVGKN